MKKLLAVVLALCLAFALCACGQQAAPAAPAEAPAQAPEAAPEAAPVEEAAPAFELTGPVTIISPYATGGGGDIIARLMAQYLTDQLGQQVNVVNKEGASGTVGSTELAQSAPDGYTAGLIGISDSYVMAARGAFDLSTLNYRNWIVSNPHALFAAPGSPWNNLGELIEDVKAGNTNIAMAESGTAHIISMTILCRAAGIEPFKTVSFSSGGESQTALLGDHVDLASLTPAFIANVEAGGGKLMCAYGTSKLEMFPDIAYALDYDLECPCAVGSNFIFALPQGCPDEVVEFWDNALQELIANPDFVDAMTAGGYPILNMTGAELDEAIATNSALVAEVMKDLGLE